MTPIKVLLVHGGEYHPFKSCAAILKETLENGGMARCDVADRDAAFQKDLGQYDVVALYTQGGRLSPAQEKRLCSFVRNGGGLVGIHCASDSFKENGEFMTMLGSQFVTHAPGTVRIPVDVANREHPLAEDLGNFEVVDEFYLLARRSAELDAFLTAQWCGEPQPMAYTKSYGDGRVFYTALGHDERAFRNGDFQRLLLRGLIWTAGRWRPAAKPVGVGILGYGHTFSMGKHHGDQIAQAGGFEIVAACDIDPTCCAKAEADYPGIMTYPSCDEMLADDAVQMVVVILPHDIHADYAIRCLDAGRHVVIEKPFCLSEKQADAILAAAKRNKRMLTVYQNRRWDHQFLTARNLVRSGVIGDVFETTIDFGEYAMPKTWWRSDKKVSGGLLLDWGAHCLDWILHIIPDQVVAVSAHYQKRKWMMASIEDHVRVILRFKNGAVADFSNSQLNASKGAGWVILGTEGAIQFPTIHDWEATVTTFPNGSKQTAQVPCEPDGHAAFYRIVRDHLHHGLPLAVQPETSARVIAIMDAAEKSARAGKELPFQDKYFGR